jgi:uncharacterized protein DUF5916
MCVRLIRVRAQRKRQSNLPEMRGSGLVALGVLFLVAVSAAQQVPPALAGSVQHPEFATLRIPKLERAPTLDDFLGMKPPSDLEHSMLKIDRFYQRDPKDGAPVSQRTEAYVGYTGKNLYVVALCFEEDARKIRARMVRRELIDSDDQFGFVLDTFRDKKHGVFFFINALGVQQDGIWVDGQDPDYSFDMVWKSASRITPQGYVAFFEIPFRSLRFSPGLNQTWGVFFERDIKRNNEASFYPWITSNAQGFLSQETEIDGMEHISHGRNMQFIPYGSLRAFRDLDDRDPSNAHFHGADLQGRVGLDTKIVLKNALVLDATINPDFSQVESDEPQVTVNQRFEVFFPEKRPFFLENSAYFDTPINLVFTRRIVDPEYGVRLTGKLGRWSLGTLFADDKSPGKIVPSYDPLYGHKAYFGVARVSYDIGKESSIGAIYTDRELNTAPNEVLCTDDPCLVGSNRVGGIDAKLKFNPKWSATLQALASHTKFNDGTHKGGPAYYAYLERSSRRLEFNSLYQDTAANFQTDTGFFRRPDIRRFSNFVQYRIRPEGKHLLWHGPSLFTINNWDHSGTRLEWFSNANYKFVFRRQMSVGTFGNLGHERLRPVDYDTLSTNQDYAHYHYGVFFYNNFFKQLSTDGEFGFGTDTNYDPAAGPPVLANSSYVQLRVTVQPMGRLTIDNTYLLTRLRSQLTNLNIFNDHIIRSKWNYQFNREFSLRFIAQYSAVLANPELTSLQTTKSFNADVLLTYLLHPGTAVYVGYNSNLQNLDRSLQLDPNGNLLRTQNRFLNDGRQIFVKISYLFRY